MLVFFRASSSDVLRNRQNHFCRGVLLTFFASHVSLSSSFLPLLLFLIFRIHLNDYSQPKSSSSFLFSVSFVMCLFVVVNETARVKDWKSANMCVGDGRDAGI